MVGGERKQDLDETLYKKDILDYHLVKKLDIEFLGHVLF